MKKILLTLTALCASTFAFTQTNTFPTTGNVGIGTTSPNDLLHISKASTDTRLRVGNNAAYDQLIYFNGSVDWSMGIDYSNSNAFSIASTSSLDNSHRFVINNNGNVGIGTISPSEKLQIGNAFTFHAGGHQVLGLGWAAGTNTDLNTSGYAAEIRLDPVAGLLRLGVSSGLTDAPGTRVSINSAGAMGIGTTSPQARLHIENGSVQIGSSTQNGMLHLGGGKGYTGIGSTRSDGGLILGKNIYARYDDATYNLNALVGQTAISGFSGIKLGMNGQIDFFGKNGSVTADAVANSVANTKMSINTNGNVGIGTTTPSEKLEVNGTVRSKKVKVEATGWPDYVFSENYKLRTLNELEQYIQAKKHLPEVPSAAVIEANGLDLGSMDATLLKKVEELTLYTIAQEKQIKKQAKENNELRIMLLELRKEIEQLKKDK